MKRFIFTAIAALFIFAASAQTPDTAKFEYCYMSAVNKALSATKVTIFVDFGQETSVWKDNRTKDEETGKVATFTTIIDALNYLGEQGWELFQAIPVTSLGGGNIYHFYMKRRK